MQKVQRNKNLCTFFVIYRVKKYIKRRRTSRLFYDCKNILQGGVKVILS